MAQKSNDSPLFVILAFAAVFMAAALVALWNEAPTVFWILAATLFVSTGILLLSSIGTIPANKILVVLLFNGYFKAYAPSNFKHGHTQEVIQAQAYRPITGNIVFYPRPFFAYAYFPTTVITVDYLITKGLYTKHGGEKAPKAPIIMHITMQFLLSVNLKDLLQVLDILENQPGTFSYTYTADAIARSVFTHTGSLLLQTVRQAVGTTYTWHTENGPEDAGQDILLHTEDLQEAIRRKLAFPHSVFCTSGLLNTEGGAGLAVRGVPDIQVRKIELNQTSRLADPSLAHYEAAAAKTRGKGEGDRIEAMAKAAGLSPEQILASETIQGVPGAQIINAGGSFLENMVNVLEKGQGK